MRFFFSLLLLLSARAYSPLVTHRPWQNHPKATSLLFSAMRSMPATALKQSSTDVQPKTASWSSYQAEYINSKKQSTPVSDPSNPPKDTVPKSANLWTQILDSLGIGSVFASSSTARVHRQNKVRDVSPSFKSASLSSWSDYEHDFIHNSSPPKADKANHIMDGRDDNTKRQQQQDKHAMWLAQFEYEKTKLHHLNDPDMARTRISSRPSITTPFGLYDACFLKPIQGIDGTAEKKNDPSPATITIIDPELRASADEYWLQMVLIEKEKLKHKNQHNKATP